VKRASQPSHSDGRLDGMMPYCIDMASWNMLKSRYNLVLIRLTSLVFRI
jgi:hypothetical protein